MGHRDLYLLAKIGKEEYMKSLYYKGEIYFQRLKTYRKYENSQIGDKNEGASEVLDYKKTTLKINGIELKSLAGPIIMDYNVNYNPFIYCLYGITSDHEKRSVNLYDCRLAEFGDFCVLITDVIEFYNRFEKTMKNDINGFCCNSKLVDYIDFNTFNGKINPFQKNIKYIHQNEFRILVEHESNEIDFKIELGSLEDIAMMIKLSDLPNIVKINE